MSFVLDYTGARNDYDRMKAAGVIGVMRYTKYITPQEADAIRKAGLHLLLVEETTANMTMSGYAGGVQRGKHANDVAKQIGYHDPIWYAVDHDVTQDSEYQIIDDFLRGAEEQGLPSEVYGEADVVDAMHSRGASRWPWQAAAWSHRRVSPHAVMYQRIDHPIFDSSVDVNDVLPGYGAWWNGPIPQPTPNPPQFDNLEVDVRSILQPEFGTRELFYLAANGDHAGQPVHRWYAEDGTPSETVPVTNDIGRMIGVDVGIAPDGKTVACYALGAYGEEYVSLFNKSHPWSPWCKVSDLLHLAHAKS